MKLLNRDSRLRNKTFQTKLEPLSIQLHQIRFPGRDTARHIDRPFVPVIGAADGLEHHLSGVSRTWPAAADHLHTTTIASGQLPQSAAQLRGLAPQVQEPHGPVVLGIARTERMRAYTDPNTHVGVRTRAVVVEPDRFAHLLALPLGAKLRSEFIVPTLSFDLQRALRDVTSAPRDPHAPPADPHAQRTDQDGDQGPPVCHA